jgi:hypothetical protein
MKLRLRIFHGIQSGTLPGALALGALLIATQLPAQQPAPTPPGINESLNNLADQPPTHMGFILDRSMLQSARGLLESNGMSPERAAAALSSISYDNYRYAHPAVYAPETMASIVTAYRTAGWKHLVDAHDPPAGSAQHNGPATDLWLHFTGSDIDGLTVMARGARNVNVIQVACDLRPLDLIHLSGHFGIPKVDPSVVMVPDPNDR